MAARGIGRMGQSNVCLLIQISTIAAKISPSLAIISPSVSLNGNSHPSQHQKFIYRTITILISNNDDINFVVTRNSSNHQTPQTQDRTWQSSRTSTATRYTKR